MNDEGVFKLPQVNCRIHSIPPPPMEGSVFSRSSTLSTFAMNDQNTIRSIYEKATSRQGLLTDKRPRTCPSPAGRSNRTKQSGRYSAGHVVLGSQGSVTSQEFHHAALTFVRQRPKSAPAFTFSSSSERASKAASCRSTFSKEPWVNPVKWQSLSPVQAKPKHTLQEAWAPLSVRLGGLGC